MRWWSVARASVAAALLFPVERLRAQAFPTPAGSPAPTRSYPIDPDAAPRPVLRAVRVSESIRIDGVMSESSWARAEVATKFVQSSPRTGHPATTDTEVRILYDAMNLYVGASLKIGPDRLVTAGLEHDFQSRRGDLFGITLDPFLDRRSSYVFATNPGGALRDEQTFDNSRTIIVAWSAVVETASHVNDSTWTLEMRIPLNSISFDPKRDGKPWGLNLIRMGGPNTEISHWAPLPAHDIAHRMIKAGYLVGLEGLRPGRSLRVRPFLVSNQRSGSLLTADDRPSEFDGGVDVKYGLTRKLTLDLTYRTDFSQLEVDQAQLNLSRFSLFFPERREFFIENEGTFTFGDVTHPGLRSGTTIQDFSLFHSRRIGLTDDGRPLPLIGGARLTGRAGPLELGLVRLHSERTNAFPAEAFTVARVKSRVLRASDIGVLYTERTGGPQEIGGGGRSVGADANFRLMNRLLISSYVATSDNAESEGSAGRVLVGWRDKFWNTSAMYRQIGAYFDPALGFLRRGDIRHYYATLGVHPQPKAHGVAEVNPYVEASHITNLAGGLESQEIVGAVALKLLSGTAVDVVFRDRTENIYSAFPIFRDVLVDSGAYHFSEGVLSLTQSASRAISGRASVTVGEFFSGTRRALSLGGAWRPGPKLYMTLDLQRNDVRLASGSFLADLASVRSEYAWSTRLFGSAWVQYDAQSNEVTASGRLVLRYAPLSDVFLVYQERRGTAGTNTVTRNASLKVTRLLQL